MVLQGSALVNGCSHHSTDTKEYGTYTSPSAPLCWSLMFLRLTLRHFSFLFLCAVLCLVVLFVSDSTFFLFSCLLFFLPIRGDASGKETSCQCRRHKRPRFDPWVGKIPWGRAWKLTPGFLPENPMDRGAWQDTVRSVAKGWTQLKPLGMHANTQDLCICVFAFDSQLLRLIPFLSWCLSCPEIHLVKPGHRTSFISTIITVFKVSDQ